jgi:hypothetical protein
VPLSSPQIPIRWWMQHQASAVKAADKYEYLLRTQYTKSHSRYLHSLVSRTEHEAEFHSVFY